MMLEYAVNISSYQYLEVNIDDETFICVEHIEDGKRMITAFIGKDESVDNKCRIKVSPHGGILHVDRMAGDALINASRLLKLDVKNKVVNRSEFDSCYQSELISLSM